MPLPHPPGYQAPQQEELDCRRVVFAGLIFSLFAAVLLGLAHRAAQVPSTELQPLKRLPLVLVVLGAGFCGAWSEGMRQLALVRKDPPDPQPLDLP